MPAFLANRRGVVARVDAASAGGVSPFSVRLAGIDTIGNFGATDNRVLITQVSRGEAVNLQLQHTFGNTIYAYVFGDRIGELRLSGICFADNCNGNTSGITGVQTTYELERASSRRDPIIITLGSSRAILGLLTGFSLELTDTDSQIAQWGFRFNTFKVF